MNYTTEIIDHILVVYPEGRLDAISAGPFEEEIIPVILQNPVSVLIDFTRLDYISSAGLRTVLIIAKTLTGKGFRLGVCNLNESAREVFHISGFDTIIPVFSTAEEGIHSLK